MTVIYTPERTPGPTTFGTTTRALIPAAPMRAAFSSCTEVSTATRTRLTISDIERDADRCAAARQAPKELGLTLSLDVGYRLSARGESYLNHLRAW